MSPDPVSQQATAPVQPWHALAVTEVFARLASSPAGLTESEVARRAMESGPNALPEPSQTSLLRLFLRQFVSPLIYLLFGAALIACAMGELSDAVVILVVVLINSVIGTLQERRAQRSMAELRQIAAVRCRVLRDGAEQTVGARELVPGDVLILAAGDAVGADARLYDVASLQVAEAVLTGEAVPTAKDERLGDAAAGLSDRRAMVYAGTHVTQGRARAVVVATGLDTEVGGIARLTDAAREPPTPLERRVDQLGRHLMVAGVGVFLLIVAVGLLRGLAASQILMIAISQMVGLIPEGLPVAITIALAVGMQRMAARGAIVRRLSAVEALGSTTVICTDKTGTLTRNEMTVTRVYLSDGRSLDVSGSGYTSIGSVTCEGKSLTVHDDALLCALCEAACACNDANLAKTEAGELRALGDPTEIALLTLGKKAGLDLAVWLRAHPRTQEIPFDAKAQLMLTEHGRQLFVKGSPEAVLRACGQTMAAAGRIPLDAAQRTALQQVARALAGQALRVLALASAERALGGASVEQLSADLTFLGFVGQLDPPREEVASSIALCRAAGVRTVMVTGDHEATGLAIAKMLGLAQPGSTSLDGSVLSGLSVPALRERLARTAVFARVQPADKVRIVEAFRASGEVVAMTGDGVNDAPALMGADVGVAMGIAGTEVAKEASKIVLTDDNFATIVRAIEEGRVVYGNVKKLVLLLLSSGVAEVLVLVLALAFGLPTPFVAVQILWNNLVTEGTITASLAMEPREGNEMARPPIARDERIVTRALLARIVIMSCVITAVTLGFYAYALRHLALAEARTATFTLLAMCEWFNVLSCRSELRSVFSLSTLKNAWLWAGLVVSALLQTAVVFAPPLQQVFHTVPVSARVVLGLPLLASLVLWVEEVRKWIARARSRGGPHGSAQLTPLSQGG